MWIRYDEEEDDPHSLYRLPHPHHHPRPHDGTVQYSDEESEEAHIDEVIESKISSRRLSSFSLNGAADAALRPSTEIHISTKFVQEQLRQKPPVQAPHDDGLELSGARPTALRAIITDPLYKALNTLAEKKNTWQKV